MKKGLAVITSILLILLITGCSKKPLSSKSTITSSQQQIVTKYYQNLSNADKKKLKFKFREDQDETKDNYADMVYDISVKITNNTDKIVKFDKSKFLVFSTEQTKFPATKTGILTLKPGQTKEVNQLIDGVGEQSLIGGGSYFIYLNKNNKLAEANFTKQSAKEEQKNQSDTSNDTNNDASSSNSDNNQQQTQTSNTDQSNIPTEGQALARLKQGASDWDTSDLTAVRGQNNDCWVFNDSKGLQWLAYDNGMLKGPGDPHPIYPDDPHAYDDVINQNDEDTEDDD